jgi:glyoxylase-like metal-dependent hydrolase (beta-lactamase superfamily II)
MSDQKNPVVHTLDLNFLGLPGTIAAYLLPHANGAALIESGPGSTIPNLERALAAHHLKLNDISDVFLTHIHLDHAGAAGWLARQGARIHVHPAGAPHLLNPEKLLASAERIYGDQMQTLWGEFLSVPEEKLFILEDQEEIEFDTFTLRSINTPGHANHHYAYIVGNICFSGDIGGVRIQALQHLRIPMPPPEFHLETWRESIRKLILQQQQGAFQRIAPTHFGLFSDPDWHLHSVLKSLDEIEAWLNQIMPSHPALDEINQRFLAWTAEHSAEQGLSPGEIQAYEAANPSWMSAAGMQRYWRKHREVS